MDSVELEVFRPNSQVVEKCICKAEKFRPCLCDYASTEDAIIDLYIMNTSKREFELMNLENIVSLGPFADQQKGMWVIAPPTTLHPGETVFARAYSDKISTTDSGICDYDVTFTVTVAYGDRTSDVGTLPSTSKNPETITPFFEFEVGTLRESQEGGCDDLQVFDPLAITNYVSNLPIVNIYNLTPQSGIDIQPQTKQDLFALEGDVRWRNTAFFIIS